jgi:phenylpyruvate tautomerase PptA (4-oxalocrotonate tautomerase family)
MPLLRIATSASAAPASRAQLLGELSKLVATRLGKPEQYVMTSLEPDLEMTFGGTTGPACYVELKNVGRFTPELTQRLSAELCERISGALGVARDRIYIEFSDAQGYLWGHDGETFG